MSAGLTLELSGGAGARMFAERFAGGQLAASLSGEAAVRYSDSLGGPCLALKRMTA